MQLHKTLKNALPPSHNPHNDKQSNSPTTQAPTIPKPSNAQPPTCPTPNSKPFHTTTNTCFKKYNPAFTKWTQKSQNKFPSKKIPFSTSTLKTSSPNRRSSTDCDPWPIRRWSMKKLLRGKNSSCGKRITWLRAIITTTTSWNNSRKSSIGWPKSGTLPERVSKSWLLIRPYH